MGISFAKFAARARIGAAAVDVRRNLIPIKEIAEMYGFHDESHFNHAFKRHFKLTPGEYRK
jgi:AraC-like DNA-binding protein